MATLQPDMVILNPQLADTDIYKLLETIFGGFPIETNKYHHPNWSGHY